MKKLIVSVFVFFSIGLGFAQTINTTLTYSVNLPASQTKNAPVLIFLHGYGSNENDLFELAKGFDSRFLTFSLRAPNAMGDGGFNWFNIDRSTGVKKYDYNEAVKSRQQILSFISNACKAYGADSTRVYFLGFSQGAMMSFDILLAAPNKIAGIVALSGRLMDESKNQVAPEKYLSKVKVFIGHGTSDNLIPVTEAEKVRDFLKSKNLTALAYHTYEMAHTISGAELNDIKPWLIKEAGANKSTAK